MRQDTATIKSLKNMIKLLVAASVAEVKIKHDLTTALSLSDLSSRNSDLAETYRKELEEAQERTKIIQDMIDADFALLIG